MNLKRLVRRLVLLLLDAILIASAFLMAYELRLNFALRQFPEYIHQYSALVLGVVAAHLACFVLFDLYRGVTRFTGRREIMAIAAGATVVALMMLVYNLLLTRRGGLTIPRSVIPLTWLLSIMFTGGMRYARRLIAEAPVRNKNGDLRRVLIIGADARGESVARELHRQGASGRMAVGFIDENSELHGRLIHGVEVFGGFDAIEGALKETGATEIIVALPSPSPREMKLIADHCGKSHASIQRLPSAEEVLDGRVALKRLRPVKIEDLLGRPPVQLELSAEDNYIKDERVLVTGAGGSIGSELCRQILRSGPAKLFLLGHGENSLNEIATELGYWRGDSRLEIILADIQNEELVRDIFRRVRPSIVFHSAAHKHVPFGEIAPCEMVRNNVFGTLHCAKSAEETGCKRFILISTDKAVRPTNVLGATKRVAEMIVSSMQSKNSSTAFMAVRFGNVLGSRGSVVPLFLRQIEQGGPLTLTDPEMTRYFMTIPEAASLVLQAGAIGSGGELMVLDMGEPVKIADLARNLVTLAGLEAGKDIEIEFIGSRPGEKIHEEILTAQEGLSKTRNGKIFVTPFEKNGSDCFWEQIDEMNAFLQKGDAEGILQSLARLVPDYHPAN